VTGLPVRPTASANRKIVRSPSASRRIAALTSAFRCWTSFAMKAENRPKRMATDAKNGPAMPIAMPPARRFAVLTCMDARLDPAKFAGLAEGDAHVIRNAGGRASDDAIRSLVISYKLLGTREWFVIHHSDCGMETFTDEIMRDLLASSLETASLGEAGWRDTGRGPGSAEGEFIDWLTIRDNAKSVIADVRRIRNHPLVPKTIPIHGYIYDVRTGRLNEVPDCTG
jgi:carbonic anhydrase